MTKARKIQVLRRIQDDIDRGEPPKPTAVGLTETEFQKMAAEKLFELRYSTADPKWRDYIINGLSDSAQGLLANAEPLPQSRTAKIGRAVAKGLWDLLKIALGGVVGWYLKKYYGS